MQKPPAKSTHMPLTPSQSGILHLLWKEHSGAVYAMLLDWCGNKTNAADILQEVFLRLARNPSSLEIIRQPRAFLFVSARRIGIDLARRNKIEEAAVESGDLEIFPTQHGVPPGDDLHQILQDAFKLLPEEQRTVLEAKLLHGKTLALIASEQGISLNTASSRLRYSLDKMRIVLRPYYVTMKKSYLNPNASQRLSSSSSVNERLIKPLEPKRVPSVSPLLAGLVALAPEHDTHDTHSDIPVSFESHTYQTATTSDHPTDNQDHNPTPAVDGSPSDDYNTTPFSAQDPEVVLTSVFEDAQVDNVASITPEPFALESFLILNTTQVSTENSGNHDTTDTDIGAPTVCPPLEPVTNSVDSTSGHDVTSTDPSTTDGQTTDPTTSLSVVDKSVDPDTTDAESRVTTLTGDITRGPIDDYGNSYDVLPLEPVTNSVDSTSGHDVTSTDPSTTDGQTTDPTTSLPVVEKSVDLDTTDADTGVPTPDSSLPPGPFDPNESGHDFTSTDPDHPLTTVSRDPASITHKEAVSTIQSASPAQRVSSVQDDSAWQNSSTINLAQNQREASSGGAYAEIGIAEPQGGHSINLNQHDQGVFSYAPPNLNFYGVENTNIEGSHDGTLDLSHPLNSHEELPSQVHPTTFASIHNMSSDDFFVVSETSMTGSISHEAGNEASSITEHSDSSIATTEILGGAFVAGTATQVVPAGSPSRLARRSFGK